MPLNPVNVDDLFRSREEGIQTLFSSILELNVQDSNSEKLIVSTINKLLSTAKHRQEGLEYLNLIISHCSGPVVAENAVIWVGYCVIKFAEDNLRDLKLRVLGRIVQEAHTEAEFNKKFTSDYLYKIVDNCLTTSHINLYECKTALHTLRIFMQHYSSSLGSYKQKIEEYILRFMDTKDEQVVEMAANAFHYLQQVGSAGPNGVNHKTNFTQSLYKISNTILALFNKFFEHETQLHHTDVNEEVIFELHYPSTESGSGLTFITARRLLNLFKFLEVMLKHKYPVSKETRPKELLEIITLALSFHKCVSNGQESLETYQFALELQKIQAAALRFLRLYVIFYQSNCLPFSYTISKTLMDSLKKMHNCGCFKSNTVYQEAVYKALTEWVRVTKGSIHPQFQSHLVECLLTEISPLKHEVTLTISQELSDRKSQKAKKRAMTERIISSGNQSENGNHNRSEEAVSCYLALGTLKAVLHSTRLNVKPASLKELYKIVFEALLNIQSGKASFPYTKVECQLPLYAILVAFFRQKSLPTLPPIHTALDLLTRGSNGENRFVGGVCAEGIQLLESLCQPICSSLYLGKSQTNDAEEEEGDVESINKYFENAAEGSNNGHEETPDVQYKVRYTASDMSTIEDGLSDRSGARSEILDFEELNDSAQVEENGYLKIAEEPVVVAPSEDGNEILEGHYKQENLETIVEISDDESINNDDQSPEVSACMDKEEIIATSLGDESDVMLTTASQSDVKDTKITKSDELAAQKPEVVHADEPEAKKAKLDSSDQDPDDDYLLENSFSDVVTDYY